MLHAKASQVQARLPSASAAAPSPFLLPRPSQGSQVELPITFPTARLPTTACAWHAGRGTALHWVGGRREKEAKPCSHFLPSDLSLKAEYPVQVIKDIAIYANT